MKQSFASLLARVVGWVSNNVVARAPHAARPPATPGAAPTRTATSLSFPNASRSYDPARRSVSFWGHDAWSEITFDIDDDTLQGLDPTPHPDEATILFAFDANRLRIERAAEGAYARRRQMYLRLQASDF